MAESQRSEIIKPPWKVEIFLGIAFALFYFLIVRGILFVVCNSKTSKRNAFAMWMLPVAIVLAVRVLFALMKTFGSVAPLPAEDTKRFFIAMAVYTGLFIIVCPVVRWLANLLGDPEPKDNDTLYPRVLATLLIAIPALLFLLFCFRQFTVGYLLGFSWHIVFYPLLFTSWLGFGAPLLLLFGAALLLYRKDLTGAPPPRGFGKLLRRIAQMPLARILIIAGLWLMVALIFAAANPGGLFRGPPLEDVVTRSYGKIFEKLLALRGGFDPTITNERERISKAICESED